MGRRIVVFSFLVFSFDNYTTHNNDILRICVWKPFKELDKNPTRCSNVEVMAARRRKKQKTVWSQDEEDRLLAAVLDYQKDEADEVDLDVVDWDAISLQ